LLDGDASATRAGKVVNHFDVLDGRRRAAKNFDSSAVGKEEKILGNRRARLDFFSQFPREKPIGPGNAKPLEHRVGGYSVAEIDHVIDHSRKPGLRGDAQLRIRRRQGHRALRFEPDAIMRFVKPNQGLAPGVRTILSGMYLDDFVRLVPSRLLQGVLDVVAWKNVIAILRQADGSTESDNRQTKPQ